MAFQMLNRRYTLGTVDGAGDITPGPAQTGFNDFTALTGGNDIYVVALQGALWSYMKVQKIGAILRPQSTYDSSSGSPITFDTGLPIAVFCDLGWQHAVFVDGNGVAQNADAIYNSLAPATLAALKTTPLPASGTTVRYLRGILANDKKGAFYVWEPADATAGDDFNFVVSALSATGRWVRQKQILELPALSADSDAYTGGTYKIGSEIRDKSSAGQVKVIPRVEGFKQNSYPAFAAFKAAASAKWAQGDLIEIRGIVNDGDIDAPLTGTWEASNNNTSALDSQFLRPDDISGSNPGRLQFPVPVRAIKFANADATPAVNGAVVFTCADIVPALITTFDEMKDGQKIIVQPGAQDQVFAHSVGFRLPNGANFRLRTTDAPIQFYRENSIINMLGGGGGGALDILGQSVANAATYTLFNANVAGRHYFARVIDTADNTIFAKTEVIGGATPNILYFDHVFGALEFGNTTTSIFFTNLSGATKNYNIRTEESW